LAVAIRNHFVWTFFRARDN